MPLSGTVLANKGGGYRPLLLATFRFVDGSILRLSTDPLNVAEGGYQYNGHDYLARIKEQDLSALQARSEQGIDRIPTVSLTIGDPHKFIWTNYEKAFGRGFKGATLTLNLIFWEPDTANFSDDAPVKFVGTCDPIRSPLGLDTFTVSANSSRNPARVFLPVIQIQQRCGNIFPRNFAERQEGATDPSSMRWECGYSPDVPLDQLDPELGTPAARGNFDPDAAPDTPFTTCNLTKEACLARGMYVLDDQARKTGRFTGIQWAPRTRESQSKSYLDGKDVTVFSSRNDAIYGQRFNFLYGTQWVTPTITNVLGDGNSTRMEAVICVGDIGSEGVNRVVVNGVEVPFNNGNADPLFRWQFVTTGARSGSPNLDKGYDGQGDPYGSMACIEIVVYRQLADGGSVPNVRVLAHGPQIRIYTDRDDPTVFTKINSSNAAWITADLLTWSNYRYTDLAIRTFQDAAAACDTFIPYKDLNGLINTHERFRCEFALQKRKSASEVIQSVLRSFNAHLVQNNESALLQLFVRQSLADAQPDPIPGSNYDVAVQSVTADGIPAPGHVAWLFDESNVLRDTQDGMPAIELDHRPSSDTPNRIGFSFQDRDNFYAEDSISVVDVEDVARSGDSGQEIDEDLSVLGIVNFDQATRCCNVLLSENFRGNEFADTRGTRQFTLHSTTYVEHLRVGHLCMVKYQQLDLAPSVSLESPPGTPVSGILVRVEKIQASTNFERSKITVKWHEDPFYTDAWGQSAAPIRSDFGKTRPIRPPYPWKAFAEQPMAGDSVFTDPTEWTFGLTQFYGTAADGTALAQLIVSGRPPVNLVSHETTPPLVEIQGFTSPTGGTLLGGRDYYMAIAAKDAAGKLTILSNLVKITVPPGTDTNTINTGDIFWADGTTGYYLFAGTEENLLCFHRTENTTPPDLTITALNTATYGPPDIKMERFRFAVKPVQHAGIWGAPVKSVAAFTITIDNAGWTPGQWAGRDVSLVAQRALPGDAPALPLPVRSFHVTDNTVDTLTLTVDPVGKVSFRDVLVMRTKPDTFTADTVGDSTFVNSFGPTGLNVNEEQGRGLLIIRGTGKGQYRTIVSNTATVLTVSPPWDVVPDATTIFIVVDPSWQYAPQTQPFLTADPNPGITPIVGAIDIANYKKQIILVRVSTEDADGNDSLEAISPYREIYVTGKPFPRERANFGIGIGGPQPVGNDLTPHYLVREAGSPIEALAQAKHPPTGVLVIDIQRSSDQGATWESIFPPGDLNLITIPLAIDDAVMVAGSPILTSVSGRFKADNVGKNISITGAGVGAGSLDSVILSYQSPNEVTLADDAFTGINGTLATYGDLTDQVRVTEFAADFMSEVKTLMVDDWLSVDLKPGSAEDAEDITVILKFG